MVLLPTALAPMVLVLMVPVRWPESAELEAVEVEESVAAAVATGKAKVTLTDILPLTVLARTAPCA